MKFGLIFAAALLATSSVCLKAKPKPEDDPLYKK